MRVTSPFTSVQQCNLRVYGLSTLFLQCKCMGLKLPKYQSMRACSSRSPAVFLDANMHGYIRI